MIHLSGVDASFLHLETPEMPMHVGSMHLLELPAGYEGDFYEDVVQYVSSRIHLASVFERKLAQMPFEMSNPVWVDDDDIDIEYHIRRIVLSKPGTLQQLEAYVGRLHSTLLDRSRPLWEMYVIEGLESGQKGLYVKVHHAAIDGQAGVALAKALYDTSPEQRAVRKPRARARSNQYQLGVAELAAAAVQNTMQQYVKLVTTFPNAVRAMASMTIPAFTSLAKLPMQITGLDMTKPNFGLASSIGIGPRTPLNVSITNQRAFAARSVSLGETKAAAKRAGVSLNDVVMAACAGALRRYMKELDVKLDRPMTAAVPVSLREPGNEDSNNQVTMMLASLATDVKDPLQRLQAIHESTSKSKELTGSFKAAIPTDFPSFGAPWIMTGLAMLYGRSKISDNIPPLANVAISNVPGVPVPLYVAGARMLNYFPVSIPAHGCALNITVQSYNGALDYGLTACRRAVPDVADLADLIVEAHAELHRLIAALPAPAAAAKAAGAGGAGTVGHPPPPPLPAKVAPMMQPALAPPREAPLASPASAAAEPPAVPVAASAPRRTKPVVHLESVANDAGEPDDTGSRTRSATGKARRAKAEPTPVKRAAASKQPSRRKADVIAEAPADPPPRAKRAPRRKTPAGDPAG